MQDTDLAAREADYHSTGRRDYTRKYDRHQETTKDTKTIEDQVSNKTTYIFSTSDSMLEAASFRDEQMTTLTDYGEKYDTGTFHVSSLYR